MAIAQPSLERPAATRGRVALYFAVRYLTPLMVLLALAASGHRPPSEQLTGLLTAQIVLALASHAMALRVPSRMNVAVWGGILADLGIISMLVAIAGGVGGPLWFLFVVQALSAGILLSSRAGVRVLMLSTASLLAIDVLGMALREDPTVALPRGLTAVAVLWILGGAGTLFSSYNEHELRRRNAELATIRRITLDIEESLTLEEIFDDLARGVCEGFGFDGAAVLLRRGDEMACVAGFGITGARDGSVPLAGRIAHALAVAGPVVTSGEQAKADGALLSIIGARGYLAVPLAEDGLLIATRSGRKGRPGTLKAHEIETLDRLAHHARLAIANARLHARVQEMAITDALTGVANHGELQRRLTAECGRIERYASLRKAGHRVSLLMIDIDDFKGFNDRFGHQAGDAVLKGVATALRQTVRSFDIVARYGGEEFAVILPETGKDAGLHVAERIREAVRAYPFAARAKDRPTTVTVSIGVSTAPENSNTPEALIKAADAALYHAKGEGKDRVIHALDIEGEGARVLEIDATRRRRGRAASPARAASPRARGQSSRPKRRTPHA